MQFCSTVADVHVVLLPFEEKQRLVFHLLDFQLFLLQLVLLLLQFMLFAEYDCGNNGCKHRGNTENDIPEVAPCRKIHIE